MQMHDYARKPRVRKVFSARHRRGRMKRGWVGGRSREKRTRREKGWRRRNKKVESKRKRDNVCYWDTHHLSLCSLSNLNANRKLCSLSHARFSVTITFALTWSDSKVM